MTERIKLSPEAKKLFISYCENEEIHSVLNVTYKDVCEYVFGWLNKQPVEVWNEVIKVLETEIMASKGYCYTGRVSRLISALDGFHPGVRISIATSDQISNRVLLVLNNCKLENVSKEETISRVTKELQELELTEDQIKEWISTIDDFE